MRKASSSCRRRIVQLRVPESVYGKLERIAGAQHRTPEGLVEETVGRMVSAAEAHRRRRRSASEDADESLRAGYL